MNCCWSWLCWISMISPKYLSLEKQNWNAWLTYAGFDSMTAKYLSWEFPISSKCMAVACFSSPGAEKFPIPNTSFTLLTSHSAGESLRCYHSVIVVSITIIFLKTSDFLTLWRCWLHNPCICLLRWFRASQISTIYIVLQNEIELRICEPVCMTMFLLSQKRG